MDPAAVLASNLTSALEQINQYLALGLATGLAALLLELSTPADSKAEVAVAGMPVPLSPDSAKWVLVGIYFVAGMMAYVAAGAAIESAAMLVTAETAIEAANQPPVSLLAAACTYPSVATAEPFLRFAGVMLPPVFSGIVIWRIYRRMERHLPSERGAALVMTAVAVWPYVALVLAIRNIPC